MSKALWYWHRFRAMGPGEIAARLRKKAFQWKDVRRLPDWSLVELRRAPASAFPVLPKPDAAPSAVREALARDVNETVAGRWKAFGHLDLQVDDPPRWHKDYLAGKELGTAESAFKLNHRELPDGADIKLIWELSRWHPLVRLAMAAYVLDDERAAQKCVEWLADWVKHNPPCRGWNWTSALEVGMRLVQYTWIDALLSDAIMRKATPSGPGSARTRLDLLAREILPAHVWYAWRYRSVGSSANNHLIGELAGLILAVTRWPELSGWAPSLDELQKRWESEVLAQFAEDGGNREQALNYHLFSWELCWQVRAALKVAGREIDSCVSDRLALAARFFWEVRREPWDYGDSDDALVAPFYLNAASRVQEWRDWLSRIAPSLSMNYWLGAPPPLGPPLGAGPPLHAAPVAEWWRYPKSGVALCESGGWRLRLDLSPLGYLETAAHGHLDALHLSVWFRGVPIVIDPGTGGYHADGDLRAWLASSTAHNAPCPTSGTLPRRLGPFLWSHHHAEPDQMKGPSEVWNSLAGGLRLPGGHLRRTVRRVAAGDGWEVLDEHDARKPAKSEFSVRWQFAPDAQLDRVGERKFRAMCKGARIDIEVSEDWVEVYPVVEKNSRAFTSAATNDLEGKFAGTVSPAFRKVEWAPFLKLVARPQAGKPCVFRTIFLASPLS